MDKTQIENCIQRVLDSRIAGLGEDKSTGKSNFDKHLYNTAYRLSKYIHKYRTKRISKDDLLISLRNYLLLFKTTVVLPDDIDIADNTYGLRKDDDGRCFATLNLPEYLNQSIIKQGYMIDHMESEKDEKYFLGVTPNIFRLTGFKYFKSIRQKLAVNGTLNMPEGYTALVSLPTGGGKSLITQTMAYQKDIGLTIAVVPTVSLAMDQVRVAKQNVKIAKDNEIACYYSDLPANDKRKILNGIKCKTLKLLFISPEALIKNELFNQVIDKANESGYLKNIIIDEAHIVIEWGNFFRVDYQCLEPWRNNLIENNIHLRTVLLSATYEKSTVNVLKSMFSKNGKWIEIRCDALRREPRFELVAASSWYDKNKKTEELLRCLPRPMIVYVTRPDQAERLRDLAKKIGITNVETFTGKTKSDERARIIDEWSENEFDLIIATSAFGVGVDKSDVRTVLHLYVPDNPNEYYQELGRGGRDGLPSLSIMCIYPNEDIDSAFAMTDKVLSPDKILGRWDSMLNSPTSKRYNDTYTIDTSVKPKYNSPDYAEDASKVDQNWNIYVILLLRRHELINITDMMVDPASQKYFIRVTIQDNRLLQITDETQELINNIRDKEWKKNEREFKTMKQAILRGNKVCWSEMFFNTYGLVSEYCAGCDNHSQVVETDINRFELVKRVPMPIRKFAPELDNIFGGSNEAMLMINLENNNLLGTIIGKGFMTVILDDSNTEDYMNLLQNMAPKSNVNVLGMNEFSKLLDHGDLYYIAGDAVVLYRTAMKDIYKKFTKMRNALSTGAIRILHIFEEDVYFVENEKNASSVIDGPVLEEYLIERM